MKKLISTNPGKNYKVLGEVKISSDKEIRDKVFKAQKAKKGWGSLGLEKRVKLLRKVVEKFQKRKEELALLATREMGMRIDESRFDVDDAIRFFTWYLDNAGKYLWDCRPISLPSRFMIQFEYVHCPEQGCFSV